MENVRVCVRRSEAVKPTADDGDEAPLLIHLHQPRKLLCKATNHSTPSSTFYYNRSSTMKRNYQRKMPHFASILLPPITRCDDNDSHSTDASKAAIMSPQQEESCDACLYTGMATCTGLSLYFYKMALLDLPEKHDVNFTKQMQTNKRFLLFCGTFWAAAGIYRWNLG
jgi:hypothetical protein